MGEWENKLVTVRFEICECFGNCKFPGITEIHGCLVPMNTLEEISEVLQIFNNPTTPFFVSSDLIS